MLEPRIQQHLDTLIKRYPALDVCSEDIEKAYLNLLDLLPHWGHSMNMF